MRLRRLADYRPPLRRPAEAGCAASGSTSDCTSRGPSRPSALDAAYARPTSLWRPAAPRPTARGHRGAGAGRARVASGVGGLPEALGWTTHRARPGLLVPPGDVDALAGGLQSWLVRPDAALDPARARPRARDGPAAVVGHRGRRGPAASGGGGVMARPVARLRGGAWSRCAARRRRGRTGSGPWLAGVRSLDAGRVALCAGIAVLTTTACAWRWHLVARQLGLARSRCGRRWRVLPVAVPQHRAAGWGAGGRRPGALHGRDVGDTRRALRAVAWERCAGQVVTIVLGLALLAVLPSPVRTAVPVVAARRRRGGRGRAGGAAPSGRTPFGRARWCGRPVRPGWASCLPPPWRRQVTSRRSSWWPVPSVSTRPGRRCCRWRSWPCSPPDCRSTSLAGVRGKERPAGSSPRRVWARDRASPQPWRTASWCS